MNRIDVCFARLKAQGRKALITFVTAGDPDIATTERLVGEMLRAGADIVELGVPFSDPVAEGPVIQAASERALAGGTNLTDIFALAARLRGQTDAPLLLMLYVNSIFRSGKEHFFARCAESGIDGVIVPDLPYEERGEIAAAAAERGIYSIPLVAPTSRERIERIVSDAKGFVYCVSSLGVTGLRDSFDTDFGGFFREIDRHAAAPTALGFGISTPEQAAGLSRYSDGIIVGSAIVRIVGEYGTAAAEPVYTFVRSLRTAIDTQPQAG